MPDLKEMHTLVVPTYNRPVLLERLVKYYAGVKNAPNLLILDSSAPEQLQTNRKFLASFGSNVRHVEFSQETEFAVKLSRGIEKVTTPFISFCADDDIVFLDAILESIPLLEKDDTVVSVHGLYLNFREDGSDVHLTCEYGNPSNDAKHAGARVFRLFQKYESLFYSLFRTKDLKEIFSEVEKLPTLHFQELFQSVGALMKGKVVSTGKIYAARRSGPEADPTRDKWQTYYWFMDDPGELMTHYLAYRTLLLDFFAAQSSSAEISRSEMQKVLDAAHSVYFSMNCPPPYFWSVLQSHWPEDPYVDMEEQDLFRLIRSRSPRNALAAYLDEPRQDGQILRWLKGKLESKASAKLDILVKQKFDNAWKCRLPSELRWLAGNNDFQARYLDLCAYLDHV